MFQTHHIALHTKCKTIETKFKHLDWKHCLLWHMDYFHCMKMFSLLTYKENLFIIIMKIYTFYHRQLNKMNDQLRPAFFILPLTSQESMERGHLHLAPNSDLNRYPPTQTPMLFTASTSSFSAFHIPTYTFTEALPKSGSNCLRSKAKKTK